MPNDGIKKRGPNVKGVAQHIKLAIPHSRPKPKTMASPTSKAKKTIKMTGNQWYTDAKGNISETPSPGGKAHYGPKPSPQKKEVPKGRGGTYRYPGVKGPGIAPKRGTKHKPSGKFNTRKF